MSHSIDTTNESGSPPNRGQATAMVGPSGTSPADLTLSGLGWFLRAAPTIIVLAALVALGYWGHKNDWTLPKFSSLTSGGSAQGDDWCSAHGVPESQCVECNPQLLPKHKEFGWCKKHGIADCPWEHPEIAQLSAAPRITAADLERAERALVFAERPANNPKCKLYQRRIQFASKGAVEKAGIDVTTVWEAPILESLTANAEITYDLTRVARLSSRAPGSVWWVAKHVGEQVHTGELLALVDSTEVGKAKAEFLQAAVQLDLRTKTLDSIQGASGAMSDRAFREADAAAREAEIRLTTAEQTLVNLGLPVAAKDVKGLSSEQIRGRIQFLGMPTSVTDSLDPARTTANLLPIVAPADGVVVLREAVAGEIVDTSKILFVIADVERMWLNLSLRNEDVAKVRLGQSVRFRVDGNAQPVEGKTSWISTSVDEKTRTVKVRANVDNRASALRANTFGQGQIVLREEKNAIIVPNEAVHYEGDCFIVFVRDKDFLKEGARTKVFHVRQVRVGAKDAQNTEIIAGLLPGELVATKGGGTLRSELLKNNLGEG
jgi:cobalt-zinc-cadmium efflux system membrane fusion protein